MISFIERYIDIEDIVMTFNQNNEVHVLLKTPLEVQKELALRAKTLRLDMNLTQAGLAARVGISVGTLKRFEKSGEIQFNHLLRIALVLDRLPEFDNLLRLQATPQSLFEEKMAEKKRQRGRRK